MDYFAPSLAGSTPQLRRRAAAEKLFKAVAVQDEDLVRILLGLPTKSKGKISRRSRSNLEVVPVNSRNNEGMTPLHLAAALGNGELIVDFLNLGADAFAHAHGTGETPLHLAAKNGHREAARLLLDYSTPDKVNLRDRFGNTCLFYAVETGDQALVHLLLSKGASIFVQNFGGKSPWDQVRREQNAGLTNLMQMFR